MNRDLTSADGRPRACGPAPPPAAVPASCDPDAARADDSRRMLATLLDNLPGMAYRCRNDPDWTMEFVSGGCRELTGYAPEYLLGNRTVSYGALVHPDDQQRIFEAVQAALARREAFEYTYRIRRADGQWRWVWERGRGVSRADGTLEALEGFITDITDRVRAEEALQRRVIALTRPLDEAEPVVFEELFDIEELQRIQDAFAEATGVASIITRPDGTPITRPSGFRRLCDRIVRGTERGRANCFHSDAMIGRHNPGGPIVQRCLSGGLWDAGASITLGGRHVANWLIGQVKSASDDDAHLARYAAEIGADPTEYRAALAEVPVMSEEQFARIAHALFVLANELSLKAYQNVQQARFIAERRATEAALRVSEERFRAIFEQAGVGVAQVESATGRFIRVNRKYADIVGRTPEALIATTVFAIAHPDDLPVLRASAAQPVGPDGTDRSRELRFVRPDGTVVWVRLTAAAMSTADEGRACHIAVVEDITSARLAAARQEQLEAQLRQAQKLEAIGRLAGGVAHDFNNLLTAILGNAELGLQAAMRSGGVDPAVAESLKQIERSAQRAAALTRQLLAFSRRQVSQPSAVGLAALVRSAEPMLRRLLAENITLQVRVPPQIRAVRADEAQLEQVLLNLVVNARDALRDGGQLTISLEDVELHQPDPHEHGELPPGSYVCLTVRDTGCGMDAATLERIFEPFFTTKELGRGTGLGLATVYGIVKQSGGHIAAQSTPGRGSTFRVWLPAAEAAAPAPAPAAVHPPATAGHETILLCEDDETVRSLTAEMLRSAGYRVLVASDGSEARRIAAELTAPLHLLVTDVIMPDTNGRQLAEELAARWPGLRVLYLSGYNADIIAHHGVLDPGVEFLEKPYTRPRLLARVREVLDRASAGARAPGDAVRASAGGAR